jgi:hypothetical protein
VQALTDLMVYLNLNPHPTETQVVVVVLGGVAVLWVIGVCVERVLEL